MGPLIQGRYNSTRVSRPSKIWRPLAYQENSADIEEHFAVLMHLNLAVGVRNLGKDLKEQARSAPSQRDARNADLVL
jgi:hypothetical protein